jgi:hypothetical protein
MFVPLRHTVTQWYLIIPVTILLFSGGQAPPEAGTTAGPTAGAAAAAPAAAGAR